MSGEAANSIEDENKALPSADHHHLVLAKFLRVLHLPLGFGTRRVELRSQHKQLVDLGFCISRMQRLFRQSCAVGI